MGNKKQGFKKCCVEEIKRIWQENGGSMNIVNYVTNCPECNHFIGLTQTSKEEANNLLKEYGV